YLSVVAALGAGDYQLAHAVVRDPAGIGHLSQLFHAPLCVGHSLAPDCGNCPWLLADARPFHGRAGTIPDAARAVILADWVLYLARREHCHVSGRLAISSPGRRLEDRAHREDQLVVPAGDRQHHYCYSTQAA